jgi:4-hydroxybenzoate polyprenyltransferase
MSGGTQATEAPLTAITSRLLAYAQLLRLPNVFTAIADIALAALITGSLPGELFRFICLVLASSCLYCAGMVWNDYFDFEQDQRERPFRPLPSFRVQRSTAARLGILLMTTGAGFAFLAGFGEGGWRAGPLIIALQLVAAIFLYDAWLKRTFLGPLSMGLCRFYNVLLGLTVMGVSIPWWGFVLALVVGTYIVGVTWFARKEARMSKELELQAATLVMLAALPISLFLPVLGTPLGRTEGGNWLDFIFVDFGRFLFPYLLVAFGFYVGIPAFAAAGNPGPRQVQTAVKRAILGLVILDAVLATSLAGTVGLLILVLLPPARYLGKWVYST